MRALASVLIFLFVVLGAHAQRATVTFVFVKIQDQVLPIERGSKYEDPLDAALRTAKLGEVTGGGTMMNKDKSIAYVGVDVNLYDLEKGLPFLIAKLRELGAPRGSTIEYTVQGRKVEQPVHQ
jgi:hypothetical protein